MNSTECEPQRLTRPSVLRAFVGDSLVALTLGLLANIFNYLFLMWAGRHLPTLAFGLFATGVTVFTLVAVMSNALQMRVTQMLTGCSTSDCREFIGKYLRGLCLVVLCLSLGSWAGADVVFAPVGAGSADIVALLLGVAFMGMYACFMGYLGARHHLRTQAIGNVAGALLKFSIAVLLGMSGSAVSLWLGSYSVHFGAIIAGGLWWWWRELSDTRHQVAAGASSAPTLSLPVLLWHVAPLLLGVFPFIADQWYVRVLAQELSGSYGAMTTLGKVSFYACGPLFVVVLPYLLRARSRGTPLYPILTLSLGATALIGGVASGVLTIYPEALTGLCYGGRYLETSTLLPLTSWTMTLYAFNYLGLVVAFSQGESNGRRLMLCAALLVPIMYQYAGMMSGDDLLGFESYVRTRLPAALADTDLNTLIHVVSVQAVTMVIQCLAIILFLIGLRGKSKGRNQ